MEKRKIYVYQCGKGYVCYELSATTLRKQQDGKYGRLVPYGDSEIGEALTSGYRYDGMIKPEILDDYGLVDAHSAVSYIYNVAEVLKDACRQLIDCIDGEPGGRYLYLLNRNASNFFAEIISNLGLRVDISLETKKLNSKYWDTDKLNKWTYIYCVVTTAEGVVGLRVNLFGSFASRFVKEEKNIKYLIKDFSILDYKGSSFNFSYPLFVGMDWNVVNVYEGNNILFPEVHQKTEEEIREEGWNKINELESSDYSISYDFEVDRSTGKIIATKFKKKYNWVQVGEQIINPADIDPDYTSYFQGEWERAKDEHILYLESGEEYDDDDVDFDSYSVAMNYIVDNGLNLFDKLK